MYCSFGNKPPGTESPSPQTEALGSGCPYTCEFTILHWHMVRYHSDLYCQIMKNGPVPSPSHNNPYCCQMQRNGEIPSATCQQIAGSETSQKEGVTDQPESYSHHQQFTVTDQADVGFATSQKQGDADKPESYKDQYTETTLTEPEVVQTHHQARFATSQEQEDADQPKSYGDHQQFTETLAEPVDLQKHQPACTEKKTHACKQCDKSFTKQWILKKHQLLTHKTGENPLNTDQSDQSVVQSSQTQGHSCPECTAFFTSEVFLLKHLKRSHNNLYCQMVRKVQIPSLSHNNNYCQMLKKRQIASAACEKIASSVTSQKQGGADKPKSRSHQQINKGFKDLLKLRVGRRPVKAAEETPLNYNLCDKGFADSHLLKKHQQHVHTEQSRLQCKHCEKSYAHIQNLKSHQQRMHTKESPFPCKQCGKGFTQLAKLEQHQRVHAGGRHFQCPQCEKTFSRSDNMKDHYKRTHTKESHFSCKHCGKGFSRLAHLEQHERVHTGEKPFHCPHCDKSFSASGNLNKHMISARHKQALVGPQEMNPLRPAEDDSIIVID